MHKIRLENLRRQPRIDCVVIVSITPSLYTLRAIISQTEYLVLEQGATVRRPSAEAVKQLLLGCPVGEYRLQHDSAYDEMIGQSPGGDNRLEIPTAAPVESPPITTLRRAKRPDRRNGPSSG